ncbi:MAG TPA: hypothetical protein VFR11_22785 [Micromonosporaceae bacterium]|nr:hypothetical protein [Micromonosporaceae bacterium]
MKQRIAAATALAAVLLLPACSHPTSRNASPTSGTSAPGASASANATSASEAPSGSPTSTAIEFTVDGAGPYQIGSMLTDLQADPGLTNVTTGGPCPGNTTAQATGVWKDVQLSFHADGSLYLAVSRSTTIPTPSGAYLGTKLAQLKTIYAQVQTEEVSAGTSKAFLVTTLSGRGILFALNAGGAVTSMMAADADYLRTNFEKATQFC